MTEEEHEEVCILHNEIYAAIKLMLKGAMKDLTREQYDLLADSLNDNVRFRI